VNKDGTILFRSLWASDYEALSQALDAAANGRSLPVKQSTKMIGPVMRAMGYVQQVMTRGGPQAVKDLWRAGLPMALAGRLATYFSPLSHDNRGIAAVLTLTASTATILGLLTAWFFA
jgi:hypothetical protein